MLIKFGLQYCVHIFINRNHLVNYIYQIFIDSNRILLVSMQLGWVIFSFNVYILTDYQIKTYAIRNLYIYCSIHFTLRYRTTFRGRPFWHQIHVHCKKHLILRYIFLSCQYKYRFCSFKYHLWRWRVFKKMKTFSSHIIQTWIIMTFTAKQ